MAREFFVGIDLGTSNSAGAIFSRGRSRVVPNASDRMLTPSAVGLHENGTLVVGDAALELHLRDPSRVALEHKRSIGSATRITLGQGRAYDAEQLASVVLTSIREDLRRALGHAPTQAVISIPASFGLPESSATVRAAEAAGFDETFLVQEPIAAALSLTMAPSGSDVREVADGQWLVYDLGGGTFDLSLLDARDGFLRVVEHLGDPYLGGRDLDAAIAAWATRSGGWPNPRDLPAAAWRRLRRGAQEAKIALTKHESVQLRMQGEADLPALCVDFDRARLASLAQPLIQRSLETCRRLLERTHCSTDRLQGVVLVGGPTVMPCLRDALAEEMAGTPVLAVDPMTAVARGAARFAATSELPSCPPQRVSAPARGSVRVRTLRLHHPALSADPAPFVVGRVLDEDDSAPETRTRRVVATRGDGRRFEAEVVDDASFCLQVHLDYAAHHEFALEAFDDAGRVVPTLPDRFSMTHGLHLDEAPLNSNVGVALADDRVRVYFEAGTPLPARRRFKHRTVEHLAAGAPALRIPIVQGNHDRAHLCHPVGWLELRLETGQPAMPAGSEVDLELQLDRSGRLRARAQLPGGLGAMEDVERLLVPQADFESLQRSFLGLRARIDRRLRSRFREASDGNGELDRIAIRFAELEGELARARLDEGDQLNRLRHQVLDLDAELQRIEDSASMQELEATALETLTWANTWIRLRGTERELSLLEEISERMVAARRSGSAIEVGRQTRLAAELGQSAWLREPRAWTQLFETLCSRLDEALDLPRAQALAERGRVAAQREEWAELRSTVDALRDLMPPTAALQRLAHGSAVR